MRPKIDFKPDADDLVEALGLTHEEIYPLWTGALDDCESGGECMALIWERAPTPQHALLAAFMVGVWFVYYEAKCFREERKDGKDSGEGNEAEA